MPYCSKCGVEVDDFVDKCPLCGTPIQKFGKAGEVPPQQYPQSGPESVHDGQEANAHGIYLAWMIVTVVFFTPFFVILTIGIQLKGLTAWAGYPLSSLIAAWIIVTLLLFYIKKPVVFATGILITLVALLFCFDILDGTLNWFFPLGLPLLVLFYALALAVTLISINVKDKGLNIAAFILIASGIFCVGLDILLSHFLTGKFAPNWSFIAISLFLPLALFFLLFHYVLKKKIKFKRFFHF